MSRKKKDWETCENCGSFLTKAELPAHNLACSPQCAWSVEKGVCDGLVYAWEESVKGVVRVEEAGEGPEVEGWLSAHLLRLHPATMRLLGFRPHYRLMGAGELRTEDGSVAIVRVWPCPSLRKLSAGLGSARYIINELDQQNWITLLDQNANNKMNKKSRLWDGLGWRKPPLAELRALSGRTPEAESLSFVPLGAWRPLFERPIFVAYLRAYLADAAIHTHSPIHVPFFANIHSFTLATYQVADGGPAAAASEKAAGDEESLSASVASLSFGNTSSFATPESRTHLDSTAPIATSTPTKHPTSPTEPYMPSLDSLNSDAFLQCTSATRFCIVQPEAPPSTSVQSFSSIGGLKDVKEELRRHILEPSPRRKGPPIQTLLLHGPSGTGKSLLLQALLSLRPATLVLDPSDLDKAPSPLLLMDSLDDLLVALLRCAGTGSRLGLEASGGSKRESGEVAVRLQRVVDEVTATSGRKLVAAVTSLDKVPIQLRRRFHIELEVGVPLPWERGEILWGLSEAWGLGLGEGELKAFALSAHSYTGADLASLLKLAAAQDTQLSVLSLQRAMKRIQPSAMKHISLTVPSVRWSQIAGEEELKTMLRQSIEWPLKHPEAFVRMGVKPPRGILLYGPPGCSKTMIARAVATESGLNFLSVKGPELFSKWVGESERGVRELFSKARRAAPSVVFFDEMDALVGPSSFPAMRGVSRDSSGGGVGDRVLAQLLTEMDGLEGGEGVSVIAATNRPDVLDPALTRPGRLDRAIYVPLPSLETRESILRMELGRIPHAELDLELLASETEGFSGAEVVALCKEAAMAAITQQEWIQVVGGVPRWCVMKVESGVEMVRVDQDHVKEAFKRVIPRTDPVMIAVYQAFSTR